MRGLINAIMVMCLLVGLVGGSIAHAGEVGGTGEVNSASAWLHVDGDADQVPADAEKNYPHHHNVCGHDFAAPAKACGAAPALRVSMTPRPQAQSMPPATPAASLLRPPIA